MSLMAAMFFVSCDNNSVNDEVQSSTSASQAKSSNNSKTGKLLALDCNNTVSDNAVVNRITGGLTGNYCDWTPTAKTIGSVSVQFEGIYGSGVRPTTSGWYVGVIAPSYVCTDGWSTIASAVSVKNASSITVGSDPSCGSFIPQNVVGADGVAFGSDFGLGYYAYSNRVITVTKKIVIWKDASEIDPIESTNPTTATEAYLVEITSVVPTHGASVFGKVNYTYTKVL